MASSDDESALDFFCYYNLWQAHDNGRIMNKFSFWMRMWAWDDFALLHISGRREQVPKV